MRVKFIYIGYIYALLGIDAASYRADGLSEDDIESRRMTARKIRSHVIK